MVCGVRKDKLIEGRAVLVWVDWQPGRSEGGQCWGNDDATRHLLGQSVRVLASGLAFVLQEAGRQHGNVEGGRMIEEGYSPGYSQRRFGLFVLVNSADFYC